MKKRLLALALCLVLAIPFVLTSCFVPDNVDDAGNDASLYNELKKMYVEEKEVTKAESITVDGSNFSIGGDFYSASKSTTSLDSFDTTTKYSVYSLATGEEIYSYDVVYNITDGFTSDYKSVSFRLFNDMFAVLKTDKDNVVTTSLVSSNGTELISGEDVTYRVLENLDAVIFDGKLYIFENDALTFKKNIANTYLADIIGSLVLIGNKYIYLDPYNNNKVVYFDKDFNFLFEKILSESSVDTYVSVDDDVFVLSNGNLIYQAINELGEYSPLIDSSAYDYIAYGNCYKISTYLLNAETREYKEISLPFVINAILPIELLASMSGQEGLSAPYGAENIAMVRMIDNKKLVYTNNDSEVSLLLYNDLSYKMPPAIDGTFNYSVISENRYIVEGTFVSTVYNEKNEVVGKIEEDYSYNESYIYTDSAVYNHNLELVYSLEENEASIYSSALSDALVIYKEVEEETVYYLLTPAQSAPVEIGKNAPLLEETYFYTIADEIDGDGTVTGQIVSIFQTNGTLLDSYTIGEYSYISTTSTDDFMILRTTDKDGNTLIIKLS